jgi:hypothetical protein
MTSIGSLCALGSRYNLEKDDANNDVIRISRRKGNSVIVTYVNCEIVALRENFVKRLEGYGSFSVKSCIFLAQKKQHAMFGVYFFIPIHNLTQSKV